MAGRKQEVRQLREQGHAISLGNRQIPPKYSVAQIIGYMKGKSSIWIAQNVERNMRNFLEHKFWARGYFVTTVGRDEEVIRAYIRNQELADQQLDQLELKISAAPKSNHVDRQSAGGADAPVDARLHCRSLRTPFQR